MSKRYALDVSSRIHVLPVAVLAHAFSFLSSRDFSAVSCTSDHFYMVSSQPSASPAIIIVNRSSSDNLPLRILRMRPPGLDLKRIIASDEILHSITLFSRLEWLQLNCQYDTRAFGFAGWATLTHLSYLCLSFAPYPPTISFIPSREFQSILEAINRLPAISHLKLVNYTESTDTLSVVSNLKALTILPGDQIRNAPNSGCVGLKPQLFRQCFTCSGNVRVVSDSFEQRPKYLGFNPRIPNLVHSEFGHRGVHDNDCYTMHGATDHVLSLSGLTLLAMPTEAITSCFFHRISTTMPNLTSLHLKTIIGRSDFTTTSRFSSLTELYIAEFSNTTLPLLTLCPALRTLDIGIRIHPRSAFDWNLVPASITSLRIICVSTINEFPYRSPIETCRSTQSAELIAAISGSTSEFVSRLVSLTVVNLYLAPTFDLGCTKTDKAKVECRISEQFQSISRFVNLTALDLSGTQFPRETETDFPFPVLLKLERLSLARCQFLASLPTMVRSYPRLTHIRCPNNPASDILLTVTEATALRICDVSERQPPFDSALTKRMSKNMRDGCELVSGRFIVNDSEFHPMGRGAIDPFFDCP